MKLIPFILVAHAQQSSSSSLTQVENSIYRIVNFLYTIFWILAVGALIWAAILFLTAGGDKERIVKAKQMVLYACIAAAVALLATAIYPFTYDVLQGE